VEVMMRAVDVFALPSYREGMPRSIIEAMASGKPVVATSIRGCREEVVEGETGLLVPVGDSQALADRLQVLLQDPELARRFGEAGQARAAARFDEEDVLDRQVAAYARLLRERLPALADGLGLAASEAAESVPSS
ncbi:MAG: glycosyltransferase, partial [Chloroflexi bacterium]|nr:glycosyltransferase [Chloroflexota bacterium]